MKKVTLIAMGLFLTIGIMASCSGRNAEKEREDSIHIADSTAEVEAAKIAVEKARMDSIRQDSIERVEEAIAAIPRFSEFLNNLGWEKVSFFKKRGFDVKVEKEWWGGDIDWEYKKTGIYKPVEGIECKFIETPLSLSFTINGDSDLLAKFYSDAKAYVAREKKKGEMWDVEYLEVNKKGNTVTIDWPGP